MDSCQLFNFLFGTKRATTELSKCFSSMGERARARPSRSSSSNRTGEAVDECNSNQRASAPASPLKQLQMKIANFASASYSASKRATSADRKQSSSSGTYRATLVHPVPGNDDSDGEIDDKSSSLDETYDAVLTANQANDADEHQVCQPLPPACTGKAQVAAADANEMLRSDKQDTIKHSIQPVAIKPLQSHHQETVQMNDETNLPVPKPAPVLSKPAKICKRVVLYDDPTLHKDCSNQQQIVSSTEVYNIVSEFGEARAKLRRVSLVSANGTSCNEDNEIRQATKQLQDAAESEHDKRAHSEATSASLPITRATCEQTRDKRSVFVQSLVQSIELNGSFQGVSAQNLETNERRFIGPTSLSNNIEIRQKSKPILLVKSLPPKTPPKTNKAKCLNIQLSLNKPVKIQQLFQDETFLRKFFSNLEPLDRCKAAQVCRLWRNVLYANQDYWKGLVNVIDCTQLRREHLVDCIISTLQTAKLKQQRSKPSSNNKSDSNEWNQISAMQPAQLDLDRQVGRQQQQQQVANEPEVFCDFDQEDVWRIQELCNRFTAQSRSCQMSNGNRLQQSTVDANNNVVNEQQQQQTTTTSTSKSSSIPSQISSTLSSVSLSSLLSPLSESNRIDSLKEKLYSSLDNRGFDAICLFGATDDDIEDLVNKMPVGAHARITTGRLNNCSISDRGLSLLVTTFDQIEELELSGCNEITNCFELKPLSNLSRLIITDCINIADGFAQKLVEIVHQLDELTIQAYHLTDAFLDYLSLNSDTSKLRRLELPNCKEITNQSLIIMAKHFNQLETLSISGSTKISDEGIEILAEQSRKLTSLDLSWCSRITDASLECIACDLGESLTDLILDRNVHITDIGLGYLATMSKLTLLHIRWCPRISDVGLESILAVDSLKYLSIAGLHQVTARSLLCLVELNDLCELELTNCPAVNGDLLVFLSSRLPKCNIVF